MSPRRQGKFEEAGALYLSAIRMIEATEDGYHPDLETWVQRRAELSRDA